MCVGSFSLRNGASCWERPAEFDGNERTLDLESKPDSGIKWQSEMGIRCCKLHRAGWSGRERERRVVCAGVWCASPWKRKCASCVSSSVGEAGMRFPGEDLWHFCWKNCQNRFYARGNRLALGCNPRLKLCGRGDTLSINLPALSGSCSTVGCAFSSKKARLS